MLLIKFNNALLAGIECPWIKNCVFHQFKMVENLL